MREELSVGTLVESDSGVRLSRSSHDLGFGRQFATVLLLPTMPRKQTRKRGHSRTEVDNPPSVESTFFFLNFLIIRTYCPLLSFH